MLSTDKLTNYNNILASIEKLTDKKIKAYIIETLNDLSDEQLQTVNSRSDILDKILRGIERYNNEKRRKGESNFYSKNAIKIIVNLFSEGGYDRLINSNPNVLELLISHCTYIQDSFDYPPETGNSNNFALLNDDKFRCLVTDENFCKFLLKTRHMDNFLSTSSLDSFMSNESFKILISNQDLILVYYVTVKKYGQYLSHDLVSNSDRSSMIDKLYSLEQQGKLYCDKKTLDLILLNLPIIKQLVYNDASDNVIETLRCGNYEKIEELISRFNKELLEQALGQNISFKYTGEPLVKSTKLNNNPKKLETISSMRFIDSKHQEHLIQDYDRKYSEYKKIHVKDVEEKAQQGEGKLNQAQVTQAIPNVQSLT